MKNNCVTNSLLTPKLGNYVPYTNYTFKIFFLENELEKYSYLNHWFLDKSYFRDDGDQNCLIF